NRFDRRRSRCGHAAGLRFDDVFRIGRSVIGTAACAGGHERRRMVAQVGGELAHDRIVVFQLPRDRVGGFGGFPVQQRGFGFHPGDGRARYKAVGCSDHGFGRGGAVEPRTTSSGLKPSFSTSPPWICAINRRAACSAICSVRCREVVSEGHEWRENGLSSKPATDKSYGTCRPAARAAASTPAAISSLEPKIAVGGSASPSRRRAPRKPSSNE